MPNLHFFCNCSIMLYLCFRDKGTFETFRAEFTEFMEWLRIKYPEDAELKEHISVFENKYQHLPMNVFIKELKRTNSNRSQRDEIKKILKSSWSAETRLTDVYEPKTSSEEECVRSYKELEQLIKSDKRNILLNSANQGRVLNHVKANMKKKGSFIKRLSDNEISISLSHCNFLIAFNGLAEKYPQIVQCDLELRFFTKHFKIVKDVAPEAFK